MATRVARAVQVINNSSLSEVTMIIIYINNTVYTTIYTVHSNLVQLYNLISRSLTHLEGSVILETHVQVFTHFTVTVGLIKRIHTHGISEIVQRGRAWRVFQVCYMRIQRLMSSIFVFVLYQIQQRL